jgi:tRNA (cytidine/uridine-2'-O-)-methyltransferase
MTSPLLHIVLVRPEIPQNTGSIGRLCAFADLRLHLIHPLGFTITDAHLRRAGMDYWKKLDVRHHEDWAAFKGDPDGPERLWLLTTKGDKTLWDGVFKAGDGFVFGNESSGVTEDLHCEMADHRLIIPRFGMDLRSLNLATSVGIAAYEGLRQIRGV